MKPLMIGFLSMFVIGFGTVPSHAKKMMGDDLSNLLIEGENRLQVHSDIPDFEWNVEMYKEVPALMRDTTLLSSLEAPSIGEPPLDLPSKTVSPKAATPWLSEIYDSPVLTLNLKASDKTRKAQMAFIIRDSHGKMFYEEKKSGTVPPQVKWPGFSNNGKPLQVGYDYSYSLSVIDEAGNPQRHSGKPFRLNSFRYTKSGKTVTTFDPLALFVDRSSARFSPEGKQFMTEVKDWMRSRYGKQIEIVTYDDDVKFATARSKAIKTFLVEGLNLPEEKVTALGLTSQEGGGYKHVDIASK